MEHKYIDISIIKPDPEQPRKTFDQEELKQLAKSIITHGLLQSIVVRKEGNEYIIIAGERRYKACLIAGQKEIACHIIEKGQQKELALIENMQRVDLDPLEEAKALKELMDFKGYTQEEMGRILGKTGSYISRKLKLLALDDEMRESLKGNLQEGHARAILSLKTKSQQKQLFQEIQENKLSVVETQRRLKKIKEAQKAKKKPPKLSEKSGDKYIDKALEELEDLLGTRVKLNKGKLSGSLNIEYYNSEDLEQLIDRLLKC